MRVVLPQDCDLAAEIGELKLGGAAPAGPSSRRVDSVTMRAQVRRHQARRSTQAGVGGIALMALGIVLTLAHIGGDVVPTVLGLAGFLLFNAGIAIGFLLVVNTRRYSRNQSYYDPDEEDDE